ncbi:MAG: L-histidine N(alpha)-methyltransferase, partial [Rubrivivax sp.]
NAAESRIEMHLEARRSLTVRWPGAERRFAAGERIHTENSYKWTPQAFEALLRGAGFTQTEAWTDARGWFGVWLAWGCGTRFTPCFTPCHTVQVRNPAGTPLRWASKKLR